MAVFNNRAVIDTRHVRSGKDGALFNAAGVMLATVEDFKSVANINNATYQPLGDAQEKSTMTSYSVDLTFNEIVISDDQFVAELMSGLAQHEMPDWSFQGVLKGRNGSEQRVIYRDCVPDGAIDLQNFTTGDVVKRAWSMKVNRPPELQTLLSV